MADMGELRVDISMIQPTKRRWFQFSLRTLLVAVTVFGCWLGWSVSIVGQRTAKWREIKAEHVARMRVLRKIGMWGGAVGWHEDSVQHAPTPPAQLSLIRRLLGDELHNAVPITRNTKEEALATMSWFPESEVQYYTGNRLPSWVAAIVDEAFGRAPAVSRK
jgi:hypothetical protein